MCVEKTVIGSIMPSLPFDRPSSQVFILFQLYSVWIFPSGLGTLVAPGHPAPEDTGPGHQENDVHTPGPLHESTRKRAVTSWDLGNTHI